MRTRVSKTSRVSCVLDVGQVDFSPKRKLRLPGKEFLRKKMQLSLNFSPQNFKILSTFLSLEERGLELKCWSPDHPIGSALGWEPKSPNARLSTLSSTCSCLTHQIKSLESCTSFPHPGCLGSLCFEVGTKSRNTNNSALTTHSEAENEGLSAKVMYDLSPK